MTSTLHSTIAQIVLSQILDPFMGSVHFRRLVNLCIETDFSTGYATYLYVVIKHKLIQKQPPEVFYKKGFLTFLQNSHQKY